MQKYGFVYIWRDHKHKRYYIGAHWGTEDDGYICSSSWMKKAYKRRPQDFKRRLLKTNIISIEKMFNEERSWLSFILLEELGKKYYNLQRGHSDKHWSYNEDKKLSVKQKISIKAKARGSHTKEQNEVTSKTTKEAMWEINNRKRYLIGIEMREKNRNYVSICPYCGKEGKKPSIYKSHFSRCKKVQSS